MPWAAVIPAPGAAVEVRNLPQAPAEPGSVLLQTLFSEVCGTDVHLQAGKLQGVPYPLLPGHVSVGRVRRVTGHVLDIEGRPIEEGQVVTFLDVHGTCNQCWYCLVARQSTRCPARKVYGITYGAEEGLLGGWCEEIYLKPGVRIVPLPDNLPPARFIAAGCALPTALHAIDRAQIRLGDSVAIQGSGPVGLNIAILARLSGAGQVLVLDPRQSRLDVAFALGADQTVVVTPGDEQHAVNTVRGLTGGRGADVTIEASGAPSAVPAGLQMTRDGGTYVIVGHYTDAGTVAINPHLDINRKHITLHGCWGSDFSHFYRGVQLLARHGTILTGGGWERIVSRSYSLQEMNEALADVQSGRVVKAVVQPQL